MCERPILFSGPMVRAILSGQKTMTRRVVRERDTRGSLDDPSSLVRCPYGVPGDLLWVREAWRVGAWCVDNGEIAVDYRADNSARREWLLVPDSDQWQRLWEQSSDDAMDAGRKTDSEGEYHWTPGESPCRWRPSIHMPRWASRLTLRVTDVRVERVQEITEGDARAEGIEEPDAVDSFIYLWDSINSKRGYGWDTNPWVWVVAFERQVGRG